MYFTLQIKITKMTKKDDLKTTLAEFGGNIKVLKNTLVNFEKNFKTFKSDNKEDHQILAKKQDHTNGDVTDLKAWKLGLISAWSLGTIIIPALGYYYVENKQTQIHDVIMAEIEVKDVAMVQGLKETIKSEVNTAVVDVLSQFDITVIDD